MDSNSIREVLEAYVGGVVTTLGRGSSPTKSGRVKGKKRESPTSPLKRKPILGFEGDLQPKRGRGRPKREKTLEAPQQPKRGVRKQLKTLSTSSAAKRNSPHSFEAREPYLLQEKKHAQEFQRLEDQLQKIQRLLQQQIRIERRQVQQLLQKINSIKKKP